MPSCSCANTKNHTPPRLAAINCTSVIPVITVLSCLQVNISQLNILTQGLLGYCHDIANCDCKYKMAPLLSFVKDAR
jgi:hypothetical protein